VGSREGIVPAARDRHGPCTLFSRHHGCRLLPVSRKQEQLRSLKLKPAASTGLLHLPAWGSHHLRCPEKLSSSIPRGIWPRFFGKALQLQPDACFRRLFWGNVCMDDDAIHHPNRHFRFVCGPAKHTQPKESA
jgi:hypothetical protein